jgi:hypothetical protein
MEELDYMCQLAPLPPVAIGGALVVAIGLLQGIGADSPSIATTMLPIRLTSST